MEPYPVHRLGVYRAIFNSPPTPHFSSLHSSSACVSHTSWTYQIKVACPFCLRAGYSRMNFIKLSIMKYFPMCWTEDCFSCGNSFFVNNNLPEVCFPCRNQVECLEKGSTPVELEEDFEVVPGVQKMVKRGV